MHALPLARRPGVRVRPAWLTWLALLAALPAWAADAVGTVDAGTATPSATARRPIEPTTLLAPGLHLTGSAGPLVVLQAGLGDDHRSWALLVGDLARDHRVLAVDRPGYGGLPRPDGPADPCTQADTTRQRLRDAGLAPPYLLVGHSLGGRYALAQALRHPGEAAGLVLVDATPPGHWPRMQAETPGLATLLKGVRATLFNATGRREFDDQDLCMDSLAAPPSPASADASGKPVTPVPTVVLASARRRPEETPEFAALLTRGQALWLPITGAARVEVVADAGHYIQRDAPDVVAAAVRRLTQPGAQTAGHPADFIGPPLPGDHTLPRELTDGLARLQAGSSTQAEVRQALGAPTEQLARPEGEVWVYNPRKPLPPGVGWLPVVGDLQELGSTVQQRLRRHELILQFNPDGRLRRRSVRALDG